MGRSMIEIWEWIDTVRPVALRSYGPLPTGALYVSLEVLGPVAWHRLHNFLKAAESTMSTFKRSHLHPRILCKHLLVFL